MCNFPCTTLYDDRFGAQLGEVGLGPDAEIRALAALRGKGVRTKFALAVGQALPHALPHALAPETTAKTTAEISMDALLLVSRSAHDLAQLNAAYVAALRARVGGDLSIALFGGRDRHLPHAPESLGIDAILKLPR